MGIVRTLCRNMALGERVRRDYRLSKEALRLMEALAKKLGVGRTHIIELAVRKMAQGEGVK